MPNIMVVHGYPVQCKNGVAILGPHARAVCDVAARKWRARTRVVLPGGIDLPELAREGISIAQVMRNYLVGIDVPSGNIVLPADLIPLMTFRRACDSAEEVELFRLWLLESKIRDETVEVIGIHAWMPRLQRIYRELNVPAEFESVDVPVPLALRVKLGVANTIAIVDPLGRGPFTGKLFQKNRADRGAAWPRADEYTPLLD